MKKALKGAKVTIHILFALCTLVNMQQALVIPSANDGLERRVMLEGFDVLYCVSLWLVSWLAMRRWAVTA